MVTVFLTYEAQDQLLVEFEENGFREAVDAEWVSDILIEFVDTALSVRCLKKEKIEGYFNASRLFPPTLNNVKLEKLEIEESAVAESQNCLQAFLDGETQVAGISSDEELSWLRHSVLFRRLVIPYVREHIVNREYIPAEENSGVFFHCIDGKLVDEVVKDKQRPDLIYGRIDLKTGEIIESPGHYYEDEIIDGEGFDSVMEELENRPGFMMNPDGSGERSDLPAAFLAAYQNSRLMLDGKHRIKKNSSRNVPVEFKRNDYLWQHNLKPSAERIYISVDTLMKLPDVEVPVKMIPEELRPETVIEITDAGYICITEIGGKNDTNTSLSLYTRFGVPMLSPVRAEAANIREGAATFLGDGPLASDGEGFHGDVAFSLLFGYRKILAVLIATDWFGKHGKTENPQSGILIEKADKQYVVRRITGKERPELICGAGEGKMALWRPYQPDDEVNLPETVEIVTAEEISALQTGRSEETGNALFKNAEIETLEQEAEKGNPNAMKKLAEKYANGDGVKAEPRKALAFYEKAYALLPEDKDLEFEIFMLKMDIDNQ